MFPGQQFLFQFLFCPNLLHLATKMSQLYRQAFKRLLWCKVGDVQCNK